MKILLLFLFFHYIEPKDYYIDILNIDLKSFLTEINETATLYIVSNDAEIVLNETIIFTKNMTICDQGLNNKLIFDGGGMNIGNKSINFLNFLILLKPIAFEIHMEYGDLSFKVIFFL